MITFSFLLWTKLCASKISPAKALVRFRALEPLRKRLGRKFDLKMSKTGRNSNFSDCEKCRLGKPRRSKRTQPRVSTLACLSHQATRPAGAQERTSRRRRFHRNDVMLVPIPNLPPFQGYSVLFGVFPGLKPWAESRCPLGTVLAASATPEDKKSKFAQSSVSVFTRLLLLPTQIDLAAATPRCDQCRKSA